MGFGGQLALGSYRLFVCGSTSVKNLLNEKLDGNRDGIPGDDFIRDFHIVSDATDTDDDGLPDFLDEDDDDGMSDER